MPAKCACRICPERFLYDKRKMQVNGIAIYFLNNFSKKDLRGLN